MSFFEKLQNSITNLSDAKKSVAYYLMDNWLEAAFLPASKVARIAKVSESVVIRFSQDLGYSGFPELQKELQEILKSRLVNSNVSEKSEKSINNSYINEELRKVYEMSVTNLDEVFNKNTIESYTDVMKDIVRAEKIVILARKNSMGPALILNVHLNEVFSKSQLLDGESAEALDIIRGLSEKDLVLIIAIPSYSKRLVQYSNLLVEKKIPQIAITNSRSNPFGENAKSVLLTVVNSLSFSNSHLGTIFIIDILIYLLTMDQKGQLLKSLEEIKVLNERFGITYR